MKRKTAAEQRHHDRVAEMGCLICQRPACIHHVHSDGYQRLTKDHKRVVPLCPDCHQHGPEAVHKIGHGKFNALHETDLLALADRLWLQSQPQSVIKAGGERETTLNPPWT